MNGHGGQACTREIWLVATKLCRGDDIFNYCTNAFVLRLLCVRRLPDMMLLVRRLPRSIVGNHDVGWRRTLIAPAIDIFEKTFFRHDDAEARREKLIEATNADDGEDDEQPMELSLIHI